ncbi:SDR family NAD(P)-dependent oxidoreductase [Streptomyces sp. NPDC048305]|uniref:SDR family NAD(P)-dependent oxidoreductase n=2 Tax=unclassified Streptomyces TaxID=2593676 RepID=UPI00371584BC
MSAIPENGRPMRAIPPHRGTQAAGTDASPHPRRPVALITGASSGIGAAVADRLSAGGRWDLLLNGRDVERLSDVAARTGGSALPWDLASEEGCRSLAEEALAVGGRVDALVAAAGLGWAGTYTDMTPALVNRLVKVNVCAVMHLVSELLPPMLTRGSGRLVVLGSVAGRFGVRGEAAYAATKGALIPFVQSLRYELQGTGVRLCLVMPGPVDTPFFARRGTPYTRSRPRPVPAGRVAEAVEEALSGKRHEITVPRWMEVPARLQGVAPHLFHRLATRFG